MRPLQPPRALLDRREPRTTALRVRPSNRFSEFKSSTREEIDITNDPHVELIRLLVEEFRALLLMIDADFPKEFADSPRGADWRRFPIR